MFKTTTILRQGDGWPASRILGRSSSSWQKGIIPVSCSGGFVPPGLVAGLFEHPLVQLFNSQLLSGGWESLRAVICWIAMAWSPARPAAHCRKGMLLGRFVLSVMCGVTVAVSHAPARSEDSALLQGVRHDTSPARTRVILDLTGPVKFETHRLAGNPKSSLPPRIYIDLLGARLGTRQRVVRTTSALLRRVRLGQHKPGVVRIVLDMKAVGQHKVFLLRDPHRLVVDVKGMKDRAVAGGKASSKANPRPQRRIGKIVLDPGHGGKDPGALGSDGTREKDIVLSIAKKLARKLRREMGVDVVLTRTRDVFIPLEDRTALANAEQADLFVSLHSNASRNHRAGGIETYYLDNTTDEAAIRLAARENSTSRRNITDLQFILSDLVQNSKLADSVSLANHVQSSLVRSTRVRYRRVKNLGVKKGLFYVLVGARMPAVLAELLFVTNRVEVRSLKNRSFQDAIVDGLYAGILGYNRELLVAKNL